MRNAQVFGICASLAWGGFALSNATPVEANAYTAQAGTYAACSSSYTNIADFCICFGAQTCLAFASYTQVMKFNSTQCSSGSCNSGTATVYTDMVYSTGRKTTTSNGTCFTGTGTLNWFGLGACAC
jgi:hypothetical protein